MLRYWRIAAAALALATSLGTTTAVAAQSMSDEAQIRALEDKFIAAFKAKDVEAIMKGYAHGVFVFDVIPPRQYVGADAYRKDWTSLLADFKGPLHADISDLVIETDGPFAWSHSIQHYAGVTTDGQSVEQTVRVTDVYHKEGGQWLIVHEHVSVPVDMSGKPDMLSKP